MGCGGGGLGDGGFIGLGDGGGGGGGRGLDSEAKAELASAFDCATFLSVQAAHCSCTAVGTGSSTPRGDRLVCIGETADPTASLKPKFTAAVAQRLNDLGYAHADNRAARAHSARVFLCAATGGIGGAGAFEDACDSNFVNARVPCNASSVLCPLNRTTERATCIREVPCAMESIKPGSAGHDLLRRAAAPLWIEIPPRGVGYEVVTPPNGTLVDAIFGTDWLLEALRVAGHVYLSGAAEDVPPLAVALGSRASGGFHPHALKGDLQAGIQLYLLPPNCWGGCRSPQSADKLLLAQQVAALVKAFFQVVIYDAPDGALCSASISGISSCTILPEAASGSTTDSWPRLIITLVPSADRQPDNEARLMPPRSTALLPLVMNASLVYSGVDQQATLTIIGHAFGDNLSSIMWVGVGTHQCTPVVLTPSASGAQELEARCQLGGSGMFAGAARITTRTTGTGVGCAELTLSVVAPGNVTTVTEGELVALFGGLGLEKDMVVQTGFASTNMIDYWRGVIAGTLSGGAVLRSTARKMVEELDRLSTTRLAMFGHAAAAHELVDSAVRVHAAQRALDASTQQACELAAEMGSKASAARILMPTLFLDGSSRNTLGQAASAFGKAADQVANQIEAIDSITDEIETNTTVLKSKLATVQLPLLRPSISNLRRLATRDWEEMGVEKLCDALLRYLDVATGHINMLAAIAADKLRRSTEITDVSSGLERVQAIVDENRVALTAAVLAFHGLLNILPFGSPLKVAPGVCPLGRGENCSV